VRNYRILCEHAIVCQLNNMPLPLLVKLARTRILADGNFAAGKGYQDASGPDVIQLHINSSAVTPASGSAAAMGRRLEKKSWTKAVGMTKPDPCGNGGRAGHSRLSTNAKFVSHLHYRGGSKKASPEWSGRGVACGEGPQSVWGHEDGRWERMGGGGEWEQNKEIE